MLLEMSLPNCFAKHVQPFGNSSLAVSIFASVPILPSIG